MHESYKKWLEDGKPTVICGCGCGKEIIITRYHRHDGIPKYILGHHMRGITHSEKHRKNNSESHKGVKNCMFGTHISEDHKQKISESNKGKIVSEETKRKISEAIKGDKSPHWKGGKSFEPYCPKFNNKKKEEVRNQYNRKCYICGKSEEQQIKEQKERGKQSYKLSIHHVDEDKEQGCNGKSWKLVPLCLVCHNKIHKNKIKL